MNMPCYLLMGIDFRSMEFRHKLTEQASKKLIIWEPGWGNNYMRTWMWFGKSHWWKNNTLEEIMVQPTKKFPKNFLHVNKNKTLKMKWTLMLPKPCFTYHLLNPLTIFLLTDRRFLVWDFICNIYLVRIYLAKFHFYC